MAKQTAAQKAARAKAATKRKVEQTQKAPATATQTAPATTSATTQSVPGARDQTGATDQTGNTPTPSLIDQAIAFSMGTIGNEVQAQSAFDLWGLMGCDALPPKLALAVFDCANDQGEMVCARLLDKIGINLDDDQSGTSTLEGRDIDELVRDFLAWRLRRYAFTASAATKMLECSQHILALQTLTLIEPEA